MLAKTARIFADHYQFYLYDAEYDHYADERLDWTTSNRQRYGFLTTEHAVYVSTVADLNDHRLRIYREERPEQASYEKLFETIIELPSGLLVVSAPGATPDDDIHVPVKPGAYQVFIGGNSIGKDAFSFENSAYEELDDAEYLTHDEFEYYDIYLVRIQTKRQAVSGTAFL